MTYTVDGHEIVTNPAELARRLDNDTVIGFDTETSGLSPWRDHIATIQLFGEQSGMAGLIQLLGGPIPAPIKTVLETKGKKIVVHNGVGFDLPFIHQAGVDIGLATWYDTLVGETAIATSLRHDIRVNLQASVKRRLGLTIKKDVEHGGWENPELTFEQVEYAIRDVLHLPALVTAQQARADDAGIREGLDMEQRLMLPTAWMTINGLPISLPKLEEYMDVQRARMKPVHARFIDAFGEINPNSWKQLVVGFAGHGITIPNTKSETLTDLSLIGGKAGELADIVLEYRQPTQRLKVWGKPTWATEHIQPDGRVHAKFWQCSTDTTRYASSDPNLEQIPKDMRKVFGWEEGKLTVALDYSQIEIRIAAKIANDTVLMALLEHEDIHTAIAATVFNVPEEAVTASERRLAKGMVFTLLFGGGAQRFYDNARRSGGDITKQRAKDMVRIFFTRFAGLNALKQRAIERANSGRITTIRIPSGLKRALIGIKLRPTVILNTMVQSTAAAGIKYAILEAHRRGLVKGYLGNQVHDELVSTVPAEAAADYAAELRECMLLGMNQAIDCNPRVAQKINTFWEE